MPCADVPCADVPCADVSCVDVSCAVTVSVVPLRANPILHFSIFDTITSIFELTSVDSSPSFSISSKSHCAKIV